jgi:F-type H+-transporting ATPase subunit delta
MISTRYARAIYGYASERGIETVLWREMQVLAKSFADYPVLRKVMNDPTILSEQKIDILTTASGVHIHEILKQIFRMVVENGRAGYMENIALMYDDVYRKTKGIVIARLTTVEPANEKIKEALARTISRETTNHVEFQTKTDPDIIGGFILEIDDKRLDASVKEQLRIMSYEL